MKAMLVACLFISIIIYTLYNIIPWFCVYKILQDSIQIHSDSICELPIWSNQLGTRSRSSISSILAGFASSALTMSVRNFPLRDGYDV